MCSNDTLVSSHLNCMRIILGAGPVNLRGIVSNRPLALHIDTEMCMSLNIDVYLSQR